MTSYSALLVGLGTVGLAFGLLSFLMFLFGAPTDLLWIAGNLVLGVMLLGVGVVLNFESLRERMSSGEAKRAGRYGSSAVLSTLLSIAIVGFGGYMAKRHSVRFDFSDQKIHSLSDQSIKLLEGLENDIDVAAFYGPIDAPPVRELLERYAYVSDRFKLEFADPNERPDLLERYAIGPEKLNPGLVRVAIGNESVEVTEVTEQNVTNAMVKLSRTNVKRVYFVVGHNERPFDGDGGTAKEGYARAADSLRNENYEVESLLLASKADVPADADVVILPGATRPLLDVERGAIDRYLARGGAVLALIDPRANTNLVDVVQGWGVDLGDDIVVDRNLALFGRATTPFASHYAPDHPITRELRETTRFHVVRSTRVGSEAAERLTEIAYTGESSWAERDLERFFGEGTAELGPEDLPWPVSIAVAGTLPRAVPVDGGPDADDPEAEAEVGEARVAVFGDADFAANEFIESYRNRDLFVNTVNWLLGDVEAISIRPNRARASRFQLSNDEFQRIRSLSLFVLPETIAVMGVFTWWSRRRDIGS